MRLLILKVHTAQAHIDGLESDYGVAGPTTYEEACATVAICAVDAVVERIILSLMSSAVCLFRFLHHHDVHSILF